MALEKWEIDSSHSGIYFSVRHLVIAKVRGHFARWSGTILVEDGDLGRGSVQVVVDTSSIDTGVADRDTHLKSADFLDVANHPEMEFTGTRVEKTAGDRLRILGDLTIRGVTLVHPPRRPRAPHIQSALRQRKDSSKGQRP